MHLSGVRPPPANTLWWPTNSDRVTDDDHEQARLDDLDESGPDSDESGPASVGSTDEGDGPDSGGPTDESRPAGVGSTDGEDDESGGDRPRSGPDSVELGVALLAHAEDAELSLADAVDRIETLTTDPALTREILDTAEVRGVIDREDGLVRPRSQTFLRFERDVVRREGSFTCRRCGASLSTGYFIQFDAGEHGPFGSSCIRKVTGRE
jgi:hypothetical protein